MPPFPYVIEDSKREGTGPIRVATVFALLDSSGTDAGIDIEGAWDVLIGVIHKQRQQRNGQGWERARRSNVTINLTKETCHKML